MLFDSPVYFLFLALVVLGYWRLDRKQQNWFLLAASYLFYGWWDWRFLLLMIGSTLVDYLIARQIDASTNPSQRRMLLILSLVINFSVLGVFKYFNFFAVSFARALSLLGAGPTTAQFFQIILPPGISFYTFQEVAYIVDVYFKKLPAAKSITDYALFISLFPHLIAGPIQRPSHLLPQVQNARTFNPEFFFDGCMLIITGLFRKCVIADQSALIANACFEGRFGHGIPVTVLGALAFALQIYGDFSGYSDLARGSAQLLGFHFMVNFRQPYLATSLQDFWRRWHISLSTWLRDYLYIPLGGNRHGPLQTYRNLMLTMLLGGLWHGANWTFVIWGGIHGVGLSAERLAGVDDTKATGIGIWSRRLATFAIVCFAWVFFRARSVGEAFRMLTDMSLRTWAPEIGAAGIVVAAIAAICLFMDLRLERHNEEYPFQSVAPRQRLALATGVLVIVFLFSASESSAFIYFQF
jgi:D-alanyl-lipoteichoic acid acyltransferase DltB (MBOAT superfamily)